MRSAPPGVWATTVSPTCAPTSAAPTGDSLESLPLVGIGFGRADDGVGLLLVGVVLVNDGHAAAEADRVGADLALVHDDGVLDHGLQFGNALFEHSLIVLRRVVFGVLAQVAVGNRNLELLGDLHFFGSLFVFKLFLHALKAFAGNNHMLGVRHRSSLLFLARAAARQNERPECLLPGILRYSMIILSALRFVNRPARGKCRRFQGKNRFSQRISPLSRSSSATDTPSGTSPPTSSSNSPAARSMRTR